jgi:acyl carrier protein
MSVRFEIREFICNSFFITDAATFFDSDSLLDQGIVDSTGIMELIEFLQRKFGVEVADGDMTPDNLDTVDRIVSFVERKRRHAA